MARSTSGNKLDDGKPNLEQLCDYVHGLLDEDAARRIDDHLQAESPGSEVSRRTVRFLRRLVKVAQSDHEARVPSDAVRLAKALGSVRRVERTKSAEAPSSLRFLPFKVAFDSLYDPAPAGARDLQPSLRQSPSHRRLVVEAGDFSVDIRLEQQSSPPSTVVVGQVLAHRDEARPVPRIPVLMSSQGRVVGQCLTSRFGEFHAEGLPREPLNLSILVADEECLEVALGAAPDPSRLQEEQTE